MTDIVERLNDAMFDIKDKTRISPDLWNPLALAICDATDEIHRLRSAIWVYLASDEDNPLLPKHCRVKANEIAHEIIMGGRQGFARRAALGEKE